MYDPRVTRWGRQTYGDPCRECGFGWTLSQTEAVAYVRRLPYIYSQLIGDSDGTNRHPDLAWTAGQYVCHVVDNLRIWAERVIAASKGATELIGTYDADMLCVARGYAFVPTQGSLWSLERSCESWVCGIEAASESQLTLRHPQRGLLSLEDVVLSNTHDSYHHAWDIGRSM